MKLWPFSVSLLLSAIIFLAGCSTPEGDWKSAKEANTVPAYVNFVAKHPHGPHVDEANAAIESLDWTTAKDANTASAYAEFIGKHPKGQFTEAGRTKLLDLRWAEAKQKNTKEGYAAYLEEYPSSPYTSEAKARIVALGITKAGSVSIIEGMGMDTCGSSFSAGIGPSGELGNVRDEAKLKVLVFRDLPPWAVGKLDVKTGAAYLWDGHLGETGTYLYIRDLNPQLKNNEICRQFGIR